MPRNDLIQVRRDTAANWTSTNPTLAAGEMGFETDTGKFKIGNGSTAWTSLLYVTDASDITGATLASNVTGSSLTSTGTLTSLAVTGDVTVDTSTLKVDATNNRVGVGTASPTYLLDVRYGDFYVGDADAALYVNSTNYAVGIGTATPTESLDVLGYIKASNGFIQGTDYLSPYTGFKNALINGNLDISQRGAISGANNGEYIFDRWRFFGIGSGFLNIEFAGSHLAGFGFPSIEQEGYRFDKHIVMTPGYQALNGDYYFVSQRIEDARTFAGTPATLSFYMYSQSYEPLSISLTQNFGTGGSPSSAITTAMGKVTPTAVYTWTKYSITVTIPSVLGKTFGTTANTSYLELRIFASAGSTSGYFAETGNLGLSNTRRVIAGLQLERGSVATPFERRPIGTELALCQRYYWRHTGFSSGPYFGGGTADASSGIYITVQHPVPMRVPPTSIDVAANITDTTNTITPSAVSIYLAGTLSTTIRNTYPAYVQYRWHTYLLNNAGFYVGCSSEL
jgi:hypothetical protein